MTRRVRLAVLAWIAGAIVGCTQGKSAELPPYLRVAIAGCSVVRSGPECELPRTRTRVRVLIEATAGSAVLVAAGDDVFQAARDRSASEDTLIVEVPIDARAVVVTAERKGALTSVRIPIRREDVAESLASAERLRKRDPAAAEALLLPLLQDPAAEVRARATGKLARIRRAAGRADEAVALLETAASLCRAEGLISDEADNRFVLSFIHSVERHDMTAARKALDLPDALLEAYPEARAKLAHYRAEIALETGDLRNALGGFRVAAREAERLGLEAHRLAALREEAMVLASLGRFADAAAALLRLREQPGADAPACTKAETLTNLGWIGILWSETSPRELSFDPGAALSEALALYETECQEEADLGIAHINAALWDLREHADGSLSSVNSARRHLEAARAVRPTGGIASDQWLMLANARLRAAEGDPAGAAAGLAGVVEQARAALLPELELRALADRAHALAAAGDHAAARVALGDVENLLDKLIVAAPLGEGRASFLASFSVASEHVGLLVKEAALRDARGRSADAQRLLSEAADVARRNHGRFLAALSRGARLGALAEPERAAWEAAVRAYNEQRLALERRARDARDLPSTAWQAEARAAAVLGRQALADLDAALAASSGGARDEHEGRAHQSLRRPGPGDLVLVYHPSPAGWLLFVQTSDRTDVHTMDLPPPEVTRDRLAAALIAPASAEIARARRLWISAFGPASRVDFHALPFGSVPLAAHAPVLYLSDVGQSAAASDSPVALVVGDPTGDLPSAGAEAAAVRDALLHHGWAATWLSGSRADFSTAREALSGSAFFHYAGHSRRDGVDGWESQLYLAEGGALTVADLLVSRSAPSRVVLSSCDASALGDELGLAQAFVVAGAQEVVASTRPVDDAVARRLMGALYAARSLARGAPIDLAQALREAQITLSEQSPGADWAAFRVFVP